MKMSQNVKIYNSKNPWTVSQPKREPSTAKGGKVETYPIENMPDQNVLGQASKLHLQSGAARPFGLDLKF